MSINKNVALVVVAVVMTLAVWMVPQTISAQSHKQRLLALSNYNTNPIRTDSVTKYCANIKSRDELISKDEVATAKGYKDALAKQFKLNGNAFMNKMTNNQSSDAINDLTADINSFGVFIGFFAVGFVLILISWTCLVCCCCCPGCCPSKCCQKPDNEPYTKCELYWPAIFLILLLLLIIIVSAIGLSKASTFKEGFSDLQCATAITFDDIVNGNVTKDGNNFFIGVNQLITQINALSTNIGSIGTQLGNLATGLGTVVTDLAIARDDIRKVPNNVVADGNAPLTYKGKINDPTASTTTTFTSLFATVLGSSNNGGIIGGFYSAIESTYTTLNSIKSNSNGFSSNTATFNSAISGITSSLSTLQTSVNNLDSNLKSGLSTMDAPKDMGSLVINLIYGIMLGLSCLALLGVVLMTFCDKYKCRHLMYFSCVFLFFLGLLGFLIAMIFSIIVPILYFACDWLSITLGSSAGFNANMAGLLTDANVRNYIAPCLNGGTGDLMNAVAPGSISDINNLKNSLTNSNLFNTSSQTATITSTLTTITTSIHDFALGLTPDVTDSDSIAALVSLTRSQDFGACTATASDSWVVSLSNTSFTSCSLSGSPASVTETTCTSKAQIETSPNPAGCVGCIDTSIILIKYYNGMGAGALKTSLDLKYAAAASSCQAPFTTAFGNVWDNYYRFKMPTMSAVFLRWATAVTSVNTVVSDFAAVNTTITNVMNSLTATVDGITNPKFGLIAGLNCLIIGEDLETLVNAVCVSNFNTLYITRLLMGIAAFGILFSMCCIVCSGVRHFKHSERSGKLGPDFAGTGDKNSFEQTEGAFKP